MGKLTISTAMFNSYVKLPESKFNVDEQKSSVYGHGEMVGQSFLFASSVLCLGQKHHLGTGFSWPFFLRLQWPRCRMCSSWQMAMDQYLYIPFLGAWRSIYQLFWASLGTKVLTHPQMSTWHEIQPSLPGTKDFPLRSPRSPQQKGDACVRQNDQQ